MGIRLRNDNSSFLGFGAWTSILFICVSGILGFLHHISDTAVFEQVVFATESEVEQGICLGSSDWWNGCGGLGGARSLVFDSAVFRGGANYF